MTSRTMTLAALVIALGIPFASAQTSETDERLKKALARFPAADADKDGVLTKAEADAFRQKKTKPRAKPRGPQPTMKRYTTNELADVYEALTFEGMPYRLLKPLDLADNPEKKYPLVLSLHGAGGKGTGNIKNLRAWNGVLAEEELQRKHPCFVVVPQSPGPWRVPGPLPDTSDEAVAAFPEIWRTVLTKRRGLGSPDPESGNLDKVFELLDALAGEFNIDENRVYVLGHSMGGFGSWTAIAEDPTRFAAAIPSAGGLSPWVDVETITDVPIWAFHGDKDIAVPTALTRVAFDQLAESGGNMKYTELKDVGHGSDGFAFVYLGDEPEKGFVTRCTNDQCDKTADIWTWLFAQRRASSGTATNAE